MAINQRLKDVVIPLVSGKKLYLTPKGVRVTSGGRVLPLSEAGEWILIHTTKGERRKLRKILQQQGRVEELRQALSLVWGVKV